MAYRKQLYVIAVFMLSVAIVSLLSMINLALDYERISLAMLEAKPIPVASGISHIYFGVEMAFAVFCAWYLYTQKEEPLTKNQKIAVAILGLIPLAGLHLLSSRTGLMVFYLSALITGCRELLRRRKYVYLFLFLACLAILPVITYQVFTSFRNKVANTIEDLQTYSEGKNRNFQSISMRLESLETAGEIFKEQPLFGAGIGDLKTEMNQHYSDHGTYLNAENRILPHNEFFYYLAAFGITGICILLLTLFYPAFSKQYNNHFLFLPFILVIILVMMVEAILERQIGHAFFTFFLLFLTQKQKRATSS